MKNTIPIITLTLFFIITKAYSQCACCAGAGIGSSNGDYNNGILTLQKKQFVVETYFDYRAIKGDDFGNHESKDTSAEEETPLKSMLISSLGIRYGIADRITISALFPYAFLHTHNGNDNGLGDLILLVTFNIHSKNNFNFALQSGVELPTGIQKGSNFDNTTVVLGSGSVDPMGGIIFLKKWNKLTLQGNGLFKYTRQGFNKNYYGSLSIQNLSLSYRVKGDRGFCNTDSTNQNAKSDLGLTLFGGYYGEWLDKIKEGDVIDENSGYYMGFLSFGTNVSFKKWSFPFTFSYPLIQQMNGEQNNVGFRLRLGIIKSF